MRERTSIPYRFHVKRRLWRKIKPVLAEGESQQEFLAAALRWALSDRTRVESEAPASFESADEAGDSQLWRCNPYAKHCHLKSAIIPQVRIEPQLRADLDAVLREGETLSEFVKATVNSDVEFRKMQSDFNARADAAWDRYQSTRVGRPAEEVIADLRAGLEQRRKELQGKHRPTEAGPSGALAVPGQMMTWHDRATDQ